MSKRLQWLPWIAAALLLAFGGNWLWHELLKKEVVAVPHTSKAQRENPALAATRLLQRHGHVVSTTPLLGRRLVSTLPSGTLMLPVQSEVDTDQAGAVLDWVRRGNTLVMQPAWVRREPRKGLLIDRAASKAQDAIGAYYQVALSSRTREDDTCRALPPRTKAAGAKPGTKPGTTPGTGPAARRHLVCVTPPGHRYPLELARGVEVLQPEDAARPLWGDTYGLGVLVFREGRGHVVLVARDYFSGNALRDYDHGELLLVLARLAGPSAPVLFVQSAERPTWMRTLWEQFWPALCTAATLILLWAWSAARRFGPALPEPDGTRRALLEHVDASGRWLWQVPGGRALLLGAVRRATEAHLRRHMPELQQLEPAERLRQLAERTGLPQAALERALYDEPARRSAEFTQQISTLQTLRAHHER